MDFDEDSFEMYEDASGEMRPGAGPGASTGSLIFERNVGELGASRAGSRSASRNTSRSASRSGSQCGGRSGSWGASHNSSVVAAHAPELARHAREDLVAPVLDASVSLVNDEDTDLDNVEMIYSGRPSTLGLDMALGRTRTNSHPQLPSLSRAASTASAVSMGSDVSAVSEASYASNASNSTTTDRPRILRFYSYADMISDENAQSRRPSLSHSISSSLLRQSPQPTFSNPFHPTNRRGSNASNVGGLASPTLSGRNLPHRLTTSARSPNTRSSTPLGPCGGPQSTGLQPAITPASARKDRRKFTLESSGSDLSNSEGDNDDESDQDLATSPNSPTHMQNATNSQTLYNTVTGPRLTRASTQNSFKKVPPPYKARTYSSASSMSPFLSPTSRTSFSMQSPVQNLNDVLYDSTLQTGTAGDVLRRKVSNAGDV